MSKTNFSIYICPNIKQRYQFFYNVMPSHGQSNILKKFSFLAKVIFIHGTSVPLSANLSIGMSAMIKAQSLNLLVGFE